MEEEKVLEDWRGTWRRRRYRNRRRLTRKIKRIR